ncbi:hypothetical protein ACFCZ6_14495 [Streptomyces hydrogenans]|uniref:hypothetical protein n=1 Tax=Streptomyces hydrogenans TaxID=1873719 RepID=UPI0035D923EA
MEWTQLLKDLSDAVRIRNTRAADLRNAGAHVSELTAQAIAAGVPGPALRNVLARMEPVVIRDRPHVCGQPPVVPPMRPTPPDPSASQPAPTDGRRLYSLDEANQSGILPWKASTVRQYFKRCRLRDIPVPAGCESPDGPGRRYTEEELSAWLREWQQHSRPQQA